MSSCLPASALAALALALASPATAGDILAVDRDGGRLLVVDRETFTLRHAVPVGTHPPVWPAV